jgi:hypothetical protein
VFHPNKKILRHLTRPTRGGAAGVLVVFAALHFIAAKVGFAGIVLTVFLTSWFFKYAYILFDHTARGFDDPTSLDIQMLNPVNEWQRLAQLAILGLLYIVAKFASSRLSAGAGFCFAAKAAVILPACLRGHPRVGVKYYQGGKPRGLGSHGLGTGPNVRPRARDHIQLLTAYSLGGNMATVITDGNHHILVLRSVRVQRPGRRTV